MEKIFWEKECAFCIIGKKWKDNSDKESKFIQERNYGAFVLKENKDHLVIADEKPRTKSHLMIIPKEHRLTIEELRTAEWNSLLPFLKEMVRKIKEIFHPSGFMLYSYNGRESFPFQSVPHFHLHILPIYRKDYGHNWFATRVKRSEQDKNKALKPTSEEYQEAVEKLQISDFNEKSKVTANLVGKEQSLVQGHCIITSKEYISSDIEKIDQETWNQMGELLQIYIKKARDKIEAKNFIIHIPLEKMSGPLQEDIDEFQLHITPFKAEKIERCLPGTSLKESVRIAKKIMDSGNQNCSYKEKNKLEKIEELITEINSLREQNFELQKQIQKLQEESYQPNSS